MDPKVIHIGIDLLGSDTPPSQLLEAVLLSAQNLEGLAKLVVFGKDPIHNSNIIFHQTNEEITMNEDPFLAIRKKKQASLCLGIQFLKEKKLDAFITCGNTGALLTCAHFTLPLLQGIDRSALMTLIPTQKNPVAVLDVGANVVSKVEHLIQFAQMGIAYQKSRGVKEPKVALLNNGTEENKGTPLQREAFQILKEKKFFAGNIEGRDVLLGHIDVLITDGFTGNIFLKTLEGAGKYLLTTLEEKEPTLASTLRSLFDYAQYPGAILAGIDGIALKCHGNGSKEALSHSIEAAYNLIKQNFIEKIKRELQVNT